MDVQTLFFVGDILATSNEIPTELPSGQKVVYFLKFGGEEGEALTAENFHNRVLSGECMDDLVGHLQSLLSNIFVPLVGNNANQGQWGEVASSGLIINRRLKPFSHFLTSWTWSKKPCVTVIAEAGFSKGKLIFLRRGF